MAETCRKQKGSIVLIFLLGGSTHLWERAARAFILNESAKNLPRKALAKF